MAELPRIYPPHYYAYNYDQAVHPLALRAKDWLDAGKVQGWISRSPNKSDSSQSSRPQKALRVLDVGCGNGRYLKRLHHLGLAKHNLYGVEMNQAAIDQLNQAGFQGYYGRLEQVAPELPDNSFDVIVLLQVLEHVANPAQIIQILAQLLRPGGRLILETPNMDGWDAQLFREGYWGGYHFPRHWHLFNRETLGKLFQDANLETGEFRSLPSHAFWILSYHHWLEHQLNWRRVAARFNPLQNIPLLSVFTGLDLVRSRLGFSTSNIQAIARKPNHP
nr:class I SAM-dependent methyltransferase [Geitlerinema sp. P-1104]